MANTISGVRDLVEKIAIEQNYRNCDIQVKPISSGGANYRTTLYVATISAEGKDDLQLFAKMAAMGEKMRQQTSSKFYETELFVYTELSKVFRHLENKHRVLDEHKIRMPKYYGAEETHLQEILVLENLSCKGFVCHDRFQPVDWQYAAGALTELAKYHALSVAYQHERPEEFDKLSKSLEFDLFAHKEASTAFYNVGKQAAMGVVREENKEKLRQFLDSWDMEQYSTMYRALRQPVLMHGEFRLSNLMHRVRNDRTVEVIPVDYQTVQCGSPVIDLLNFIFSATDAPFRTQHFQRMVDHYYSQLSAALARLHLKSEHKYSRMDFDFEMKEKLVFGMATSVLFLPIRTAEEEDAPKMDDNVDLTNFCVRKPGPLFAVRLNEVVDDYVKWGILC